MPLTETIKMGLHRKAWKYFYQNFERIPRRMEFHLEVLLATKVSRLREQYSQQPWQRCIHSWNVSFHASSSVDCGWTCQVRLQKFTWGLTRRTWWQQQEQFPYLSKKKQFTWFPFCEMKTCSGRIHDLSHISTQNCLAVCLTKLSEKADNLITPVQTVSLLEVDAHPNFRTLM